MKLEKKSGRAKPSLLLVKGHQHGSACDHGDADDNHAHGHDDHAHHHHVPPAKERPHGVRDAETSGTACQLELAFVLPTETDNAGRFAKLEQALEALKGISDVHLRSDLGHHEVCVHYEPNVVSLNQVLALVRSTGADIADRYQLKTWFIRGMDSHQCVGVIEHALSRVPGVMSAKVAYAAERLILEFDTKLLKERDIEKRLAVLGYELEIPTAGHACSHHAHGSGLAPRLALPLGISSGVLLALGFALRYAASLPTYAATICFALSLVAGGFFPTRDALRSLRQKQFDIETLMVLAAVGAALLGAWMEGAFLLFLFSLGHAFEHRAMNQARRAVEALGKLRPIEALVKRGEGFVATPVADVRRGDVVLVRAGDRVPLDGLIRQGCSSLDQATVTGESLAVAKGPGDGVFAGTVNLEAAIEIEVTKLSNESLLAKVVDMVVQAEAQKGPTQRFTQRLERRFVPIVLVAAAALPAVLLLMGMPLKDAVLRGLSLLVAASPCALAISTPAAVLSAVARAARGGILMKGGAHLESLGKVTVMAFDKTGTLTEGRPQLLTVAPAPGCDEARLLGTAATVEALSNHPLAKSVVTAAAARNIALEVATGCAVVHGKGIRSQIAGEVVSVGSQALFADVLLPPAIAADVDRLEAAGQTTMIVRRGDQFLGVLGVADQVRPAAVAALKALKALGIRRTMMLSGDNLRVAKSIAAVVGIDDARAPLMPDGKVAALRELGRAEVVAMVGDGVNDAPALAAASVGIAMGGAGSDVALETADVILMGDDLNRLTFAVRLARAANRVIRQNLVVSLGVSGILVVSSVMGWTHIGQAVVLHEGSTLVVVLNGLRLLLLKDE